MPTKKKCRTGAIEQVMHQLTDAEVAVMSRKCQERLNAKKRNKRLKAETAKNRKKAGIPATDAFMRAWGKGK